MELEKRFGKKERCAYFYRKLNLITVKIQKRENQKWTI